MIRDVVRFARDLLHRKTLRGFSFDRPLVVLQSDDWGRVGVRDKEGYEQLQASGISLGEQAYDFYSLETAEDVIALRDLLLRHRDSAGRPARIVMNFVMANLDFSKMSQDQTAKIQMLTLDQGLPGNWKRPSLFEALAQGIAAQVFFPALHGLTHFNAEAVEHALAGNGDRRELLRTLWKAETPYIHWRMPWVGYEYLNPEAARGFLPLSAQCDAIAAAAQVFHRLFGMAPVSACAPGYRANTNTHQAWSQCGIRVAQSRGKGLQPPVFDEGDTLRLSRVMDFEPAYEQPSVPECVALAEQCFSRGIPAIVSVHSINFHSSLEDFRGPTLRALDQFLSAMEARHSDLLYVHDEDIYHLIMQGRLKDDAPARVNVRQLESLAAVKAVLENN